MRPVCGGQAKARGGIMLAPERREKILEAVLCNKSILVKDLCAMFNVTGETIRKDLSALAGEGKVLKAHGGAYVAQGVRNEIHVSLRETIFTQPKRAIGRACAQVVKNGDVIALDESTTSCFIARSLLRHEHITVLTNSIKVAGILCASEGIKILLCGGTLDSRNQSLTGAEAVEMLSHYYVDKAFVSCRGLDRNAGVTDGSETGGYIRRLLLERAAVRYLVADCTKLNLVNFYKICDFGALQYFVTDRLDDPQWRTFFLERGVGVILGQDEEEETGCEDRLHAL